MKAHIPSSQIPPFSLTTNTPQINSERHFESATAQLKRTSLEHAIVQLALTTSMPPSKEAWRSTSSLTFTG